MLADESKVSAPPPLPIRPRSPWHGNRKQKPAHGAFLRALERRGLVRLEAQALLVELALLALECRRLVRLKLLALLLEPPAARLCS